MFTSKDLSVLSYANGFTLWHYRTDDPAVSVLDDGYFNDASHMIRANDIIVTNAGDAALQIAIRENVGGQVSAAPMLSTAA